MRTCIVTVYNSLNYGSYYQAYALNKVLSQSGNKSSFLDTKARNPLKQTIRSSVKGLFSLKFSDIYFQITKYNHFRNANRAFKICKNDIDSLNQQDIYVFGSDEIWNISRKEFNDFPIFFGIGIPDKKSLVSYAPSINITTVEQLKENRHLIEAIERFDKVSVRDSHSLKTLSALTLKEISIVLDPTFLLNKDEYSSLEEDCKESDYILVYSYGHKMSKERIEQIRTFAKGKNLKLISVGNILSWCDYSVPASPSQFLSYVKNANYIITDTFHGTVFSIIYNKAFVSYCDDNRKIIEILTQFDLQIRNCYSTSNLEELIDQPIDYHRVNKVIETQAGNSVKFLNNAITRGGKIANIK